MATSVCFVVLRDSLPWAAFTSYRKALDWLYALPHKDGTPTRLHIAREVGYSITHPDGEEHTYGIFNVPMRPPAGDSLE